MNIFRTSRIIIPKYYSPILYVLVVFISLASISLLMGISENMYYECDTVGEVWACRGLPVDPLLERALSVSYLLLPGILLLVGNVIIGFLVGLNKPTFIDHIRQTCLLYIPIVYFAYHSIQFSIRNEGASWDAPGAYLISFYLVFAILVNALYLILKRVWLFIRTIRTN